MKHGDEIFGFFRGLSYAGAKSLIASLWSVDDEATQTLMMNFYTHLNSGESIGQSLQRAQKEMIGEGRPPWQWAAFQLNGDHSLAWQ